MVVQKIACYIIAFCDGPKALFLVLEIIIFRGTMSALQELRPARVAFEQNQSHLRQFSVPVLFRLPQGDSLVVSNGELMDQ